MPRSSEQLLRDVVEISEHVRETMNDVTLDDYSSSWALRMAVERALEIVGEALRQLRDDDPDVAVQIDGLQSFVSLRNVIAHRYAVLEDQILWTTATDALPRLARKVTELLGNAFSCRPWHQVMMLLSDRMVLSRFQ